MAVKQVCASRPGSLGRPSLGLFGQIGPGLTAGSSGASRCILTMPSPRPAPYWTPQQQSHQFGLHPTNASPHDISSNTAATRPDWYAIYQATTINTSTTIPPPITQQNPVRPLSSHGASPSDAAPSRLNRPAVKMKRTGGRPEGTSNSFQSRAPPTAAPPVGPNPSPSTAPQTGMSRPQYWPGQDTLTSLPPKPRSNSVSSSSSDGFPSLLSNIKTAPDSKMRDVGHEGWAEDSDDSSSDSSEEAAWQTEQDKSSATRLSHNSALPIVPSVFSSAADGRRYDEISMSAQDEHLIPLGCY